MFSWLSRKTQDLFGSAPRSSKWRRVRDEHIRREPLCRACGRARDLEAHHITPVHAGGPELDPQNLVTLCRDCHHSIGHAYDWKAWRPDVKRVADTIRSSEVKR